MQISFVTCKTKFILFKLNCAVLPASRAKIIFASQKCVIQCFDVHFFDVFFFFLLVKLFRLIRNELDCSSKVALVFTWMFQFFFRCLLFNFLILHISKCAQPRQRFSVLKHDIFSILRPNYRMRKNISNDSSHFVGLWCWCENALALTQNRCESIVVKTSFSTPIHTTVEYTCKRAAASERIKNKPVVVRVFGFVSDIKGAITKTRSHSNRMFVQNTTYHTAHNVLEQNFWLSSLCTPSMFK